VCPTQTISVKIDPGIDIGRYAGQCRFHSVGDLVGVEVYRDDGLAFVLIRKVTVRVHSTFECNSLYPIYIDEIIDKD
jgi:hypothetical protein